MSAQKDDQKPQPQLRLREIPGDYGLTLVWTIKDRLDFFYNQGRDNFFISRIQKLQSTLSLFSWTIPKVEKRDVFLGTYKPSTAFTGGYRVCSYLDPSEPDHAALKYWFLSQLSVRKDRVIPLFRNHLADLFLKLEDQVVKNGKADFNDLNDQMSFNFIFELFCDRHPSDTTLKTKGPKFVTLWLLPQLTPQITFGLPKFLNLVEDFFLHTVPFPALLVKPFYNSFTMSFGTRRLWLWDEAESLGLRETRLAIIWCSWYAINMLMVGMKVLFPACVEVGWNSRTDFTPPAS
ncbi:hypothetical protein M0R45_007950 [Rubus argutus]|uniref:Uncharacterized protein n=1 Tax=Rubus argutus TaxID=59490 RepID=A0AAW1XZY5_RUBAR